MLEDARMAVRRRVGSNIKRLRKLHDLTQEGLAQRTEDRQSRHVGQIERFETNVGLDVLTDLAEAFKVDVQEFFAPTANDRPRKSARFARVPSKDLELLEDALGAVIRALYRSRR
jgi:transcriptional regulator with XRE-family HTH domain